MNDLYIKAAATTDANAETLSFPDRAAAKVFRHSPE